MSKRSPHTSTMCNTFGEDMLYEEKTVLRHRRTSTLKVLGIGLGLIIAFLLLFFAARVLFRVHTVTVEGCNRYSCEQIADGCGITEGDFMFSFATSEIKKRIGESFPYVATVEVKRKYPSLVNITVTEYEPEYICEQMGKYIVFSADLKVLEVSDTNMWENSAVLFELPTVARALEGKSIEFLDTERTEYISDFILALSNIASEHKINTAKMTDIFNIEMKCDGKYRISFGKYTDIELKMKTLAIVMSSETVRSSVAASIDVSDPKQPRVIPYDRVEGIEQGK